MSEENDSSAPKSFEEAQILKERLRSEKAAFFAGLGDEAIAELERIHKSKASKEKLRGASFVKYNFREEGDSQGLRKKP